MRIGAAAPHGPYAHITGRLVQNHGVVNYHSQYAARDKRLAG